LVVSDDDDAEHTDGNGEFHIPEVEEIAVMTPPMIDQFLDNLDLAFITTHLKPTLPAFHKKKLDEWLPKILSQKTNFAIMENVLPKHLCKDYKCVDLKVPRVYTKERVSHSVLGGGGTPNNSKVYIQPSAVQFQIKDEKRKKLSMKLDMEELGWLIEGMLCFIAFLKYGSKLLIGAKDIQSYENSINMILEMLCTGLERGEGTNEWKLQKTLELSHFLEDILQFGSAGGFSTQTGERGLKYWAKIFAITAQKRSDSIFLGQVAQHIHEGHMLSAMSNSGPENLKKEDTPCTLDYEEAEDGKTVNMQCRGKSYRMAITKHTAKTFRVSSKGKLDRTSYIGHEKPIEDWFFNTFKEQLLEDSATLEIQLYTELKKTNIETNESNIFRAHPQFDTGGLCLTIVNCFTRKVG
jgi:hypothetical protein